MNADTPTPDAILQTALGVWGSKVLLTAVELKVFTTLGDRAMTGTELGETLGLHPRGSADFFDALVAMKFLDRDGDGPSARYGNTPAGALYLDEKSPRYVGGIMVMLNARLFKYWNDLPEALRTGQPQNEVKYGEKGDVLKSPVTTTGPAVLAMRAASAAYSRLRRYAYQRDVGDRRWTPYSVKVPAGASTRASMAGRDSSNVDASSSAKRE